MSYLFLELQAYSESCRQKEKQPCGRWMLYMYHRRSHMDAATGSMLSEQHIYQQEPEGFSQAQIQSFFDRVNYARESLPAHEHPDEYKLGHWLHLKFKKCRQFDFEIRKFKASTARGRARTFSYLWDRIHTWLLEQLHDENARVIDLSLIHI